MQSLLCSHQPPCPGCPRLGEAGPAPKGLEALREFGRARGLEAGLPRLGEPAGFRTRARLAVRGRARSPKIGIFQQGSHRIADIPRCPIHHPLINSVAAAVKQAVRATGITPYADGPHRGELRYLQVSVADEQAQVVLVGRSDTHEPLAALEEPIVSALGDSLHSLFWNGQPRPDNAILGPVWHCFRGPPALCETHGDTQVFYPPGAFRQSQAGLAATMAEELRGWIPPDDRVVEYFAGCGVIGLPLLARGHRVAFNERDGDSLRGLEMGLAALPKDLADRFELLPGAADEQLGALDAADTVVLDPPRRGAGDGLVAALRKSSVERVVYVSCGLPSFLREGAALTEGGRFRLRQLVPFDLFPYTDHVETAALFEGS